MSKNIVLLSDGTGNAAGKVWRTNVWRTFQSLDLKTSDQIAIYDDGVGTSSFKPLAILGGAFGYGLKRNVINLYKFLCRNYRDGDKIYAFGFSRGAFTVRIVVGLVLNQGLVKFANEAELDRKARAAYRAYRHDKYPVWNLQYPFRLVRSWLDKRLYTPCERVVDSIEFVGVWDTVAAYGLPIDEMTRGVNDWLGRWSYRTSTSIPKSARRGMRWQSTMSAQHSTPSFGMKIRPIRRRAAQSANPMMSGCCRSGSPVFTPTSAAAIRTILSQTFRWPG